MKVRCEHHKSKLLYQLITLGGAERITLGGAEPITQEGAELKNTGRC